MWQAFFDNSLWDYHVTDFVVYDVTDTQINNLLTNALFLDEYGDYFDQGITGWKFGDETTIIVQYFSWLDEHCERKISFNKLNVV